MAPRENLELLKLQTEIITMQKQIVAEKSDDPGILYIAGYGRSGSTLLDSLLNDHPSIFGAGEMMWLFQQAAENGNCSCGQLLNDCSFWRDVMRRVANRVGHHDWAGAARLTLKMERLRTISALDPHYTDLWSAAFDAVREVSGKSWVVDSSKNTRLDYYRLPLLARHMGCPVKIIHLVRDPRAVMWSAARGSNRQLEKGGCSQGHRRRMMGGLMSWVFSNATVEALCRRHPEWPVLRVRYEDLVSSPGETLGRIGRFIDQDMQEIVRRIHHRDSFSAGHGIAGNRMRRSGEIILRLDREWESKLPHLAHASSLFAWPLLRRYQYIASGKRHSRNPG